ncbi:MAG: hypothetical protein JO356_05425 [Acidobacteria bacterium]|nr:hypothetical protein [Acidobacteriota bacterium]
MFSFILRAGWLFLLVLGLVCGWRSLAPAQDNAKRLILKDGSYQVVTQWEVQADRVHYYSAERAEWEDVPSSMVDWDATNQYERDRRAHRRSPHAVELDKELEAARQEEEAKSPHVAPGLRLPPEGGVYVLDTYLTEPQLVPLEQSNGEVNRHVGRNVLRAAINPVAGAKHTIELAGPSAKVQVHASLPAFYLNLDSEEEEGQSSSNKEPHELPWDRFRVLRVQVKGDKRIVGAIKTAIYGKVTQEQQSVNSTAEQLGEGWVKITPKEALQPGEYVVAEMLGKEGMNSYVWDFGIHPDGPPNLSVIRPDPAELKQSARQPQTTKKPEQ